MAVQVKGKYRDLWTFLRQPLQRRRRIRRASSRFLPPDPLLALTTALHPVQLELAIAEVRQETPFARTYKLVAANNGKSVATGVSSSRLPPFRAGQYLSLEFVIQGVRVSRPYSICCSPTEAREGNFYEITVRRRENGFVAPHIWELWQPGSRVWSSGPLGQFGYEPLRDRQELVFLAGGCGITPFRSLWRELRAVHPEVSCTILYGAGGPNEFIFRGELETLGAELPERFRIHFVAEEAGPGWNGLNGLLTGRRIRELVGDKDKTFFVCGPPGMYRFLKEELEPFGLPPGALRQEPCGESEAVALRPDFPEELKDKVFTVKVHCGESTREIPAGATEPVLIALERAGLAPPAHCRSGQCGYCRSRIINGRIYVLPDNDGRRAADRRAGRFHPCSSYPLSDLEIRIPVNPLPAHPLPANTKGGAGEISSET
jgi:ferredoxin-NADP reductase